MRERLLHLLEEQYSAASEQPARPTKSASEGVQSPPILPTPSSCVCEHKRMCVSLCTFALTHRGTHIVSYSLCHHVNCEHASSSKAMQAHLSAVADCVSLATNHDTGHMLGAISLSSLSLIS